MFKLRVIIANPRLTIATVVTLTMVAYALVTSEFYHGPSVHREGVIQSCDPGLFKSWSQGVITRLQPVVEHDCNLLISGSQYHIRKLQNTLKSWKNNETDDEFLTRLDHAPCADIQGMFTGNFYISPEELDFPIAYTLVVHSTPIQVVRFLKAIYRPHNLHCIHVDAKSDEKYISVLRKLSSCLDNLFVASKLTEVYYKHSSTLEAQLYCLEDLVLFDAARWRYMINLVGTELPLKTNREIVQSLKEMHRVSLVDSHPIERKHFEHRFTYKGALDNSRVMYNTGLLLAPIPHNITIYKGSTYFAATRKFTEFILTNDKAVVFRKYMQDVWMPEESFYASLYRLPESATYGGYVGSKLVKPRVVENVWSWTDPHTECTGKVVHGVCIITSPDLKFVYRYGLGGHFFFNKYFLEEDPVVMDCAEERLVQLNMKECVLDYAKYAS